MRLIACVFLCVLSLQSGASLHAEDFQLRGVAGFSNLQATMRFQGAAAPYVGKGLSRQLGLTCQTGSIQPDAASVDVSRLQTEGVLTFQGVQGPNPFFGGQRTHVIHTARGDIYCTWTATFTARFTPDNKVTLSGDGLFTITGGSGLYRQATGEFRTLFATGSVPATADVAVATVTQGGHVTINR